MRNVTDPADVLSSVTSRVTPDDEREFADIQALFTDALSGLQSLGTDSPDLWRPLDDWQID